MYLISKIKADFSDRDRCCKEFLRALVLSVLFCSKKEAKNPLEIDPKKFTKRSDILKSFFSNKNLQPDILYAVQYLDHRIQHSSKNLMHAIFKCRTMTFLKPIHKSIQLKHIIKHNAS